MFGEEGNSFVDMLNTKGANLDLFLKSYTMSDFTYDNAKSGHTHIRQPVLNILLIVQDYIAREIYKSQKLARVGPHRVYCRISTYPNADARSLTQTLQRKP